MRAKICLILSYVYHLTHSMRQRPACSYGLASTAYTESLPCNNEGILQAPQHVCAVSRQNMSWSGA